MYVTSDSSIPIYVNRKTSSGTLISLRQDNAIVGSIGTAGSRPYISSPSASLHSGLIFTDNGSTGIIAPSTNSGAVTNGTINLGYSAGRFKDLYLSGGAYLGGTAAANKLDSYEEGTWTPTIIGSTSGSASLTVATSSYTKIGNTVRADCYITTADVTGLSGAVRINGLPFSVVGYAPVSVTYCNLFSFDEADGVGGFTDSGNNYVNLVFGSSKSLIQGTSANATSGTVMLSVVYKTSA